LNHVLRTRQRRLVNYQQHCSLSGLIHITPSTDELSTVTCLQLYLGTKQDCRRGGMLIERMQHMTSLAIHLDEERLPKSLGTGYEGSGLAVIRTLFIGKTLARRCPNLKALRIESMWFASAGDVLPTLLDLGRLEHLQLSGCNQTNRLYESLSQLQLTLRSFTDELSCNGHYQGLLIPAGSHSSTSAFLSSLKFLNKFRMRGTPCDSGTETFDWAALAANASSIRILEMTDHRGNGPFSKGSSLPFSQGTALLGFRALCDNATQLRQLSICGPEVDASDWDSSHGLKRLIVRHSFLSCRAHFLT
jgi:hypothetical protein